jgi:alpha-L-rhamnosidase
MYRSVLNFIEYFSKNILVCVLLLILSDLNLAAQSEQEITAVNEKWHAQWISCPDLPTQTPSVVLFRKAIELPLVPDTCFIQISTVNSYVLYVNDKEVDRGSIQTSAGFHNYQRINIASALKKGTNIISVRVTNYLNVSNKYAVLLQPSLILQGENSLFDTNDTWRCFYVKGWFLKDINPQTGIGSYLHCKTDSVDGQYFLWNWKSIDFDDKAWKPANVISSVPLILTACPYPNQSVKEQFTNVLWNKGSESLKTSPFDGKKAFVVAPRRKISILIDSKHLTSGYSAILVSGGSDSKISVLYAEALIDRRKDKGNRNVFTNKKLIGIKDVYFPDGGERRLFEPSYPRTFRFIQLDVETHDKELIIHDFYNQKTGYLFPENSFSSDDQGLVSIQEICRRTVQLCSQNGWRNDLNDEPTINLPDTRVQALATFCQTGDVSLWREAMLKLAQNVSTKISINQSDSPDSEPSALLSWVDMVYDYWMYSGDSDLVKQVLPQLEVIVNQYKSKLAADGLLQSGSAFTDWDRNSNKPVSIQAEITMHYAWALVHLGKIYKYLGMESQSNDCFVQSETISTNVYNLCYDDKKSLLADTPEKTTFSQQTNIMGIVSNTFAQTEYQQVAAKLFNSWQLMQCSPYYKIYLFEALRKTSDINNNKLFSDWQTMLMQGLTTTSESLIAAKTDCHARSTAPLYAFSNLLLGIAPMSPGFSAIAIKPHFINSIKNLKGTQKTPRGIIILDLTLKGESGLEGFIALPEGTTGILDWNYKHYLLKSGKQKINIKN